MKSPSHDHLKPKKSLGQHFLTDKNIIHKIIDICHLSESDQILEIGSGKGALTKLIAPKVKQLTAVEKDKDLAKYLSEEFLTSAHVQIIQDDILKFPFETITSNTKLVGNLPYNISTPIIEKILNHKEKFSFIFIMVQLEYGQRLIANPNTKEYSSFTLFVNYHADVKMLFKIKNGAFYPPPKVESCFLQLIPRMPCLGATDEKCLFQIIRTAFQQRRKTIQNSLSCLTSKKHITFVLEELKLSEKLRAENLLLEDYVRIAQKLSK